MVTPADEYFHAKTDDPFWNESGWFSLNVAEAELSGFIYVNHRPNMGYSLAGIGLWDPSGKHTYDSLWHDYELHPTPDGSEMFDFSIENGLQIECVEPLERYRFVYKRGDCAADLTWHAILTPHDSGLPEGWADQGKGHYAQTGRIEGSLSVDGRSFTVDAYSLRDHSWGPRHHGNTTRGGFDWGIASDQNLFIIQGLTDRPPDDDPVIGTREKVLSGLYVKDGVRALLTSGTRTVVERADAGYPTRVVVDAVDETGRELHAEGRCVNRLGFLYPYTFWWWCLTDWEFDGIHAWGEEQDFYNATDARRFLRSLKR